jgi:hypothetical protein
MFKKIKKSFLWRKAISPLLLFPRNVPYKQKKKAVYKRIFAQDFKLLQNNKAEYIVSLTSHGRRLESTLPYALYSLFTQNEMPDRIILYLNKEKWNKESLPQLILKFIDKGLEVRFVQDVGPHTKLVPALMEYPNSTIITADDDIYYPEKMLEVLISEHKKGGAKICCYRLYGMHSKSRFKNFLIPLGVYGVLYPPNSLHPMVTDFNEFSSVCPTNDDLWFWAMAKLKGTETSVIDADFYRNGLSHVDIMEERTGLYALINGGNQNYVQMKALLDRFPEIKRNYEFS